MLLGNFWEWEEKGFVCFILFCGKVSFENLFRYILSLKCLLNIQTETLDRQVKVSLELWGAIKTGGTI
jgi:hypothetical protein